MKYLSAILILSLSLGSYLISQKIIAKRKVIHMQDVVPLLEAGNSSASIQKEIAFWKEKYEAHPNQATYLIQLGKACGREFEKTGEIALLKQAEEYLLKANENLDGKSAGVLRSLAKNAISQHRFLEAEDYLRQALALGEKKRATKLMLFDVYMELGRYPLAESVLREVAIENDFDYLIRYAKWQDYKGNLNRTIAQMRMAETQAEQSRNKELKVWLYSNLGDFYGHDGQINKAYQYYLKTLEEDKGNWYALKGLAWIAYASDRNLPLAKQLTARAMQNHRSPDLYLLLSEMADYEGNHLQAETYVQTYLDKVQNPDYGDMYNKTNCLLYAENPNAVEKAIAIAQREIEARPTPMSYDLLAWSLYQNGEWEKAKEIADRYVYRQTSEPEALFHLTHIYRKAKENEIVAELKKELAESAFELGPLAAKEIAEL